jgi:hypothetical protein
LLPAVNTASVIVTGDKLIANVMGINENPEQGFVIGVKDTDNNLSWVTTTPAIKYCRCR